jgi:carbon storage regulator CsrA
MLVLSRKEDQIVTIKDEDSGNEITIMVVDIGKNVIKLGIQAPRSVTIERDDIRNRPQDPMKRAS